MFVIIPSTIMHLELQDDFKCSKQIRLYCTLDIIITYLDLSVSIATNSGLLLNYWLASLLQTERNVDVGSEQYEVTVSRLT